MAEFGRRGCVEPSARRALRNAVCFFMCFCNISFVFLFLSFSLEAGAGGAHSALATTTTRSFFVSFQGGAAAAARWAPLYSFRAPARRGACRAVTTTWTSVVQLFFSHLRHFARSENVRLCCKQMVRWARLAGAFAELHLLHSRLTERSQLCGQLDSQLCGRTERSFRSQGAGALLSTTLFFSSALERLWGLTSFAQATVPELPVSCTAACTGGRRVGCAKGCTGKPFSIQRGVIG